MFIGPKKKANYSIILALGRISIQIPGPNHHSWLSHNVSFAAHEIPVASTAAAASQHRPMHHQRRHFHISLGNVGQKVLHRGPDAAVRIPDKHLADTRIESLRVHEIRCLRCDYVALRSRLDHQNGDFADAIVELFGCSVWQESSGLPYIRVGLFGRRSAIFIVDGVHTCRMLGKIECKRTVVVAATRNAARLHFGLVR